MRATGFKPWKWTMVTCAGLGALGCGGPAAKAPAPAPAAAAPSVTPEPPAPITWAALEGDVLTRFVAEGAAQRLKEVQPELDVTALDRYAAEPSTAPALSGRAVEQLMNLALVALAEGQLDRAEGLIRLARASAKNRNSAFAGTTLLSVIARQRAAGAAEAEAAVAAVLRELPRARLGSSTVVFQLFQEQKQLSARVEQAKAQLLSHEGASSVLMTERVLGDVVTHRELYLKAISVVRSEHDAKPPERAYPFQTVDLSRARDTKPVVIAVWDVGTDPERFKQQLFKHPSELPNGKDDDGDGVVDDVHGIVDEAAHTELLYQPAPEVLAEYKPFLRGIMDLRAGMATSAPAQQVLALMRGVEDAAALDRLEQHLDAVGEWAHGTHVAGIMLQGVPTARLAIFRSAWAGEARVYHHRGPTDAELAKERANVEAIATFIKRHQVRVVNASLGFSQEYVEAQLRYETDKYPTEDAVKARAKEVQAARYRNWAWVFDACPDTLFVVAAGNSNEDVEEYAVVPAGIRRENTLSVGAVDRFGSWAAFTNSHPELVPIFDFGVEVPSLVPSGETVPLSGTSMAAPNVANLAAKLLAVHPGLTPAELKTLIVTHSDAIAAPYSGRIANEVEAVKAARARRAAK